MGKLGTHRWVHFDGRLRTLFDEVRMEIYRAEKAHRTYASWHEAYAILQEEVDEFFDSVKADDPDPMELVQVAAVALRAICDLVSSGVPDETP